MINLDGTKWMIRVADEDSPGGYAYSNGHAGAGTFGWTTYKRGKVWSTMGALKNHMSHMNYGPSVELVELHLIVVASRPLADLIAEGKAKKAQKEADAKRRAAEEIKQRELLDLKRLAEKHRVQLQFPRNTQCHGASDGECNWKECPQTRDGEPETSGRHCPLDNAGDED